jgi:Tol biopolymer transport system component
MRQRISKAGAGHSLVVLCTLVCALAAGGGTTLSPTDALTARYGPTSTANGGSYQPIFSGNGRYVVFLSDADNLVTNDNVSPFLDIFVHDLLTTNTALVAVNRNGSGGGNGNSFSPSISSNGQFVAFVSTASNLVAGDTNGGSDVFVRDIVAGTTALVSVDRSGQPANDPAPFGPGFLSSNPQISPDGRFVAFESRATNLTSTLDENMETDVFVRDLQSGVTRLVSVNLEGTSTANGRSHSHSMTPDGRYVAFVSSATNITVPGTTNTLGEIYVRDMEAGVTYWCSTNAGRLSSGSGEVSARCRNPVISADGAAVVFVESSVSGILCYSFVSNVLTRIGPFGKTGHKSAMPQISSDGRYVAYPEGPIHQTYAIRLFDRATGSNTVIAGNPDSPFGFGLSHLVGMTPDARHISFLGTNAYGAGVTNPVSFGLNGLAQAFVHDTVAGTTHLITLGTNGMGANRSSEIALPAMSSDGQKFTFEGSATDLVASDLNDAPDVFYRDVSAATNWRPVAISRAASELRTQTGTAHSEIWPGSLSESGGVIAFTSSSVGAETNDYPRLFLRNFETQTTMRIDVVTDFPGAAVYASVNSDGSAVAFARRAMSASGGVLNSSATFYWDTNLTNAILIAPAPGGGATQPNVPMFSRDGKLLVFESNVRSEQIAPGFSERNSGGLDVFVRDLATGTNLLISQHHAFSVTANGASYNATISPNGRWVGFQSHASDIFFREGAPGVHDPGPWGIDNGLYVRDLLLQTNRPVSFNTNFAEPATGAGTFSGNSEWIAYGLSNARIYVRHLLSGQTEQLCQGCTNAVLNENAQFSAYEQWSGFPPRQIVLRNRAIGFSRVITVGTAGEPANGNSTQPRITPDGRYVAFQSTASNLVENDTNGCSDIFLSDRITGALLLVTVNRRGTGPGDGPSSRPVLSGDGRTLAFQSFASDLVERDYNDHSDVFVVRLSEPDSDHDGMDDDFEVTFFGNLNREGTGDFDSDGRSDAEELRAGTDPADNASVLRVITIGNAEGGAKNVLWSAAPGRSYRVQYKDDLDAAWRELAGIVTASSSTGSKADVESPASRRFYRVVLAE